MSFPQSFSGNPDTKIIAPGSPIKDFGDDRKKAMKKTFYLFFALLLWTHSAFAAIAFDAKAHGTATSGTTVSATLTIVDGTNSLVIVKVADRDNVNISGCTCGGNTMTQAVLDFGRASTYSAIYYYLGASAGSKTVTCTFNSSITKASVVAISYTGVKQSAQPDATAHTNGFTSTAGNQSVSITTVADNSLIVGGLTVDQNWGSVAVQSPFTGRYDAGDGGLFAMNNSEGDYILVTHGAQSVPFNVIGYESWVIVAASFSPAATGANYVLSEDRFTGGSGGASSTNYQVTESSFDPFSNAPMASTNYALETKVGAGGAGWANINSVSPSDFTKFYSDQSASYTVSAVSQDGNALQYRATQDSTVKTGPQSSGALSWTLSNTDIGRHTMSLEAIDPNATTLKKQEAYVVRRPTK